MEKKTALVVTSIAAPNPVLKDLSKGALENDVNFYMIGDVLSPADFHIEGCDFYSLESQYKLDFSLVKGLPERHYARKNLGYLLAMQNGASMILETDDDNFPRPEFWGERKRKHEAYFLKNGGWNNVYRYFTDAFIWPRGYPLEELQSVQPGLEQWEQKEVLCPVQQGLADDNPDVDAVYRLTYPLPIRFEKALKLALGPNTWCPFNSQNTTWFREAFPLMYLPSYCTFRMTDIWRSFVAQRILWENNWHLLFHEPTVWQERNEHNLMKDFKDEVPGYLNNDRIVKAFEKLPLKTGAEYMGENLLMCYESLVKMDLVGRGELALIEAWNRDLGALIS